MMALVFAVQGSFWPLLGVHLADQGILGRDRGWIFATLAIGSTIVPLGAGQLVDRLMETQRLLAMIYAIGAGLLALLASGWVRSAGGLFGVFLGYWALTAPAYSLCNAMAMRNLDDPGREFGRVRLWGTAGWMVAGWVVSVVMAVTGSTADRPGCVRILLGRDGVLRGHRDLLLDPAPHAAPGGRPSGGGHRSRRSRSAPSAEHDRLPRRHRSAST